MRTKLILLLVIILAAGGAWLTLSGGDDTPPYRMEKITKGSIARIITAEGVLNPVQLINVGTQASGKIVELNVKVNDNVKEGQLLAQVDPALMRTTLKRSEANLELARSNFEQADRNVQRNKELLAKEFVAKIDLETAQQNYLSARNSYEDAKIQVEQDKVNLGYTQITSPIDGVIISVDIKLGETVAATFQTPNMFKIAGDLKRMEISANLAESDVANAKEGQPVTFNVDAYPDREFKGIITKINLNPNSQQGVVTYTATISVENNDLALLPGMTANMTVTLSEVKNVLRIPASSLRFVPPRESGGGLKRLFGGGGHNPAQDNKRVTSSTDTGETGTIYLWKDNTLTPVQVKLGATDDTYVEASGGGIAEGDMVVTGMLVGKR